VPYTSRTVVLLATTAILTVALLAAVPYRLPGMALALAGGVWLAIVLVLTLPSDSERAGAELSRRLARFRHAVNAIGDQPSRDDLEGLLVLARELGLVEDEIAEDLSRIRASLDALALRERLSREGLPTLDGIGPLPAGDRCHFMCPVRFGRRRSDQFGHLLLTSGWLRFRGALDLSIAWSEVTTVQRAAREVIVTLHDSNRALRFGCHTLDEAVASAVIAEYLVDAARRAELALPTARGTPLAP
jgi:hypothetical protein